MKITKLCWVCMVAMSLSSCDQNDDSVVSVGNLYELHYINGGIAGVFIEKENLDFNEFIEFFQDSTFIKRRIYNDSTSTAGGDYLLKELEQGAFYELNYTSESPLVQSCGASPIENLRILSDKELYNGSYIPCDGPGYGYRLVE